MDAATTDRLVRMARARGFDGEVSRQRPLTPGACELFLFTPGADRVWPGRLFVLEFSAAVFAHGGPAATTVYYSTPSVTGEEFHMGTLPSLTEALAYAAWLPTAQSRLCRECLGPLFRNGPCQNTPGVCIVCCTCPEHPAG